jgi:hypothetical protein
MCESAARIGKFEEVWGRMGKFGESLHPDVLLLYSDFSKRSLTYCPFSMPRPNTGESKK